MTCLASSGTVPANYVAIVRFLTAHGYTGIAAAGIAGNIYQESKGNPESVGSGGGGLIGWTPLPPGFVTGAAPADLRTQLKAILAYNQQWSGYLPALNAATSAAQAADIYMYDFERPGIPAASNREAAASAVAAACGL
ncbi:MAG TPA: phage tail tip lysozyme [Streptosporangiaceae bacterium]|nr:phage tail tip lysozyme [Streptosporangiaceae bacterium]